MGRTAIYTGQKCTVGGCEEAAHCRGVCRKHYRRFRRSGEMSRLKQVQSPLLEWVTRVVNAPRHDKCSLWPFAVSQRGYGAVAFMGRTWTAHRVALMLSTGMYGIGLEAAHAPEVCHNRLCCNPAHLRWATRYTNAADKVIDGTDNRGEKNFAAKLTEDQVLSILADARPPRQIAGDYPVSEWAIRDIKKRRKWRHLQPAATA